MPTQTFEDSQFELISFASRSHSRVFGNFRHTNPRRSAAFSSSLRGSAFINFLTSSFVGMIDGCRSLLGVRHQNLCRFFIKHVCSKNGAGDRASCARWMLQEAGNWLALHFSSRPCGSQSSLCLHVLVKFEPKPSRHHG